MRACVCLAAAFRLTRAEISKKTKEGIPFHGALKTPGLHLVGGICSRWKLFARPVDFLPFELVSDGPDVNSQLFGYGKLEGE